MSALRPLKRWKQGRAYVETLRVSLSYIHRTGGCVCAKPCGCVRVYTKNLDDVSARYQRYVVKPWGWVCVSEGVSALKRLKVYEPRSLRSMRRSGCLFFSVFFTDGLISRVFLFFPFFHSRYLSDWMNLPFLLGDARFFGHDRRDIIWTFSR